MEWPAAGITFLFNQMNSWISLNSLIASFIHPNQTNQFNQSFNLMKSNYIISANEPIKNQINSLVDLFDFWVASGRWRPTNSANQSHFINSLISLKRNEGVEWNWRLIWRRGRLQTQPNNFTKSIKENKINFISLLIGLLFELIVCCAARAHCAHS